MPSPLWIQWNKALAERFFGPEREGTSVLFQVDIDTIIDIAKKVNNLTAKPSETEALEYLKDAMLSIAPGNNGSSIWDKITTAPWQALNFDDAAEHTKDGDPPHCLLPLAYLILAVSMQDEEWIKSPSRNFHSRLPGFNKQVFGHLGSTQIQKLQESIRTFIAPYPRGGKSYPSRHPKLNGESYKCIFKYIRAWAATKRITFVTSGAQFDHYNPRYLESGTGVTTPIFEQVLFLKDEKDEILRMFHRQGLNPLDPPPDIQEIRRLLRNRKLSNATKEKVAQRDEVAAVVQSMLRRWDGEWVPPTQRQGMTRIAQMRSTAPKESVLKPTLHLFLDVEGDEIYTMMARLLLSTKEGEDLPKEITVKEQGHVRKIPLNWGDSSDFSDPRFISQEQHGAKWSEIILENEIPLLAWAFGEGAEISLGGQELTQTARNPSELRFVQSPHSEHNYRQWAEKEPGQNIVFQRGG